LFEITQVRKKKTKIFILFQIKIVYLFRYYDQLHAIEYKLPITENQIRIYFKWQDAFISGGSLFGSKQKTNGSWKLSYEKACVLFNIGHAYSELAVAQNLSINEQMKSASRYFQLSSGVFSFLKDYVNANSLSDLSVDFEPAILASISWLMLAQAAELIYLKSVSFKGKKRRRRKQKIHL
jgi:programmed cell death 6-interacting protein